MTELVIAFGVVFVAELGDKTQLAAAGFGARYRLAPVVAGLVAAYAATNLVSVLIGGILGASLPTSAINVGGGLLFLGFAIWNLRTAIREPDDPEVDATAVASRRVFWSVATGIFVAELGDKTMLATATLAATGNPVRVWVGATLGIIASGLVGVLLGRLAGARFSRRTVGFVTSGLFGMVGVGLLTSAVL